MSVPRTTWRPLTLAGPPLRLTGGFSHADWTVSRQVVNSPFSPCVCHPDVKGVCTHAGSGPSRVRRHLLWTCLGDPINGKLGTTSTKRPTGVPKCRRLTVLTRVEFLFPPQALRVAPQQPEHLRSHQKIDTLGSNDHACHRGCNSRFDEGNHVVDDRPVHNNGTCLCFPRFVPPLPEHSCHCCSRDLTCQQISHVVCTSL